MDIDQPVIPEKIRMIARTLGKPLEPGKMGVLLAQAGTGKTACLTHIALEHLFGKLTVLHICVDEIPEKIKVWYSEFLKNIAASHPGEDSARLQHRIEPLRFILAYMHQSFSPDRLENSLKNLRDQAKFNPTMVVLDGLDFDRESRATIEELSNLAGRYGVSLWMSARTHRHVTTMNAQGIPYPCNEMDDLFDAILLIETIPGAIRVKTLKHAESYHPKVQPGVLLDPQTYLVKGDRI